MRTREPARQRDRGSDVDKRGAELIDQCFTGQGRHSNAKRMASTCGAMLQSLASYLLLRGTCNVTTAGEVADPSLWNAKIAKLHDLRVSRSRGGMR